MQTSCTMSFVTERAAEHSPEPGKCPAAASSRTFRRLSSRRARRAPFVSRLAGSSHPSNTMTGQMPKNRSISTIFMKKRTYGGARAPQGAAAPSSRARRISCEQEYSPRCSQAIPSTPTRRPR